MSRYSVRVQLVKWFEIVVNAPSPEDAVTRAEGLRPDQIKARGKPLSAETGLADPESTQEVEGENGS
jgi:hypothetical protein